MNPNENPITKVYLLDVPLENDYKNTLYFTSKANQQSYFQSRVIGSYSYTDFTYQRKDNIIRIPEQYDKIYNCNYVMYQNSNYSNKWFYAFVTDLEYISDGRTDLHIETDVMQTWAFDYNVKSSFVEREHVDNDTIGANTVPEGLETGDYITCKDPTQLDSYPNGSYICVAVSQLFNSAPDGLVDAAKVYNGIYSGLYYLICVSAESASRLLQIYDKQGKGDAVTSVFLVPKPFVYDANNVTFYTGTVNGIVYSVGKLPETNRETNLLHDPNDSTIHIESISIPINTKLGYNSYTPVNNKLFTWPYNYLILSNNNGSEIQLSYEDFTNNTPKFKVVGSITPGCSTRCVPINYKRGTNSNDIDKTYIYGINGGKFPICSWASDVYTNWLTQNGVNNAINIGSSIGTMALGGLAMATGVGAVAGASMVASGITGIASTLGSKYQHSMIPDQAKGNTNSGDVTYSSGNTTFTVYQQCIKEEYARIIDNYFTMFGYKVNRVKIPNKAHRSRYWYTKTIDVNINGNIPQNDMNKIKQAFNKGITFWRNANEIEDYSLSNAIV